MDDAHYVKTDVAVIGGGPAGTAAALTLLRYTKRKVVLVEGTNYEFPRAGETVSAAIAPFLEYLGARPRIESEHKLESYASEAAWGTGVLTTRDALFTGRGTGWHLDRRAFDAALAKQVSETGGELINGAWLRSAMYRHNNWEVELGGDKGRQAVFAKHVIDATGRRCSFAQRVGAKRRMYDQLVGVLGYFEANTQTNLVQSVLVESTPNGWWYSAPIPSGRIVIAFMTDADELRAHELHERDNFLEHLVHTKYTRRRVVDSYLSTGPHIFSAGTQQLDPCIGPAWVAVGDAATAFDPLSSLGIGHALASGVQGARIVDERLRGSEELAHAYHTDAKLHMKVFRIQHQRLYRMERRWSNMPFWKRRHQQRPN